jgi:hypothetical protein
LIKAGACATRGDRERDAQRRRREKLTRDKWWNLVGWLDFYHILIFELNYFIAN